MSSTLVATEAALRGEEPAALLRPCRAAAGPPRDAHADMAAAPPRVKLRYRERLQEPHDAASLELRVNEVMSRDVTAIHARDLVQQAALVMAQWNRAALPVLDDHDKVVGMLTDRDIAVRVVARGRDPLCTLVANCMTCEPYACRADERMLDCLHEMAHRQIRRVPVLDEEGKLIGIVTATDAARYAAASGNPHVQRALSEAGGRIDHRSCS
ncbi:MAG TPA: CBS domain-containing protein [Burkholderiales bacterium]|nr:CBS domain-containing protein [Burkholderiales bacterium]